MIIALGFGTIDVPSHIVQDVDAVTVATAVARRHNRRARADGVVITDFSILDIIVNSFNSSIMYGGTISFPIANDEHVLRKDECLAIIGET